ncbi:phosphocarrier protein [Tessaracoccus bendigoensis DSM 12906]|uniref:Phosphocarrier protein HPr n=1 Tax=Tessaracoccus bendigoensis DSM 12906 TaxID=1123357 RepID=A0A1M6AB60_9ACTN|nr:HPr family phosphocarrier protein [Tessaracoccus bendigoensis]SHI33647.1 phosphocarrier protein [Tessaracoccus bendigoensis DSM 12906]
MASKTVIVGSTVGLHARPAALVAQAAAEFDDDITLRLSDADADDAVDAGSSMMIMSLGAAAGDEIVVESDNAEAVEKLAALIEQNLDA